MAQPYIGEIRMFAGNFAPAGWFFCEGQLIPISEYETLFNLIGTTYGGDGESTFAMPDLRGRIPIHNGNGFQLAQTGGVEAVTLDINQIPSHTHALVATTDIADSGNPANAYLSSTATGSKVYSSATPSVVLQNSTIVADGGGQPHTNLQPYLCVSFIISLFGIFPSQT
ncbi:phage tail protein [Flavobacterium sp.]|uniref:phage tail protein n=1 Tax=Flavobacterium sp. TaxID=239 RepID=UPI00374DCDB6